MISFNYVILSSIILASSSASDTTTKKAAIVIGSNAAAPGRHKLRYAHNDANEVAAVLTEVAGFSSDSVHLLLEPEPKELLRRIEDVTQSLIHSSEKTLLFFYYSGHSDQEFIFPSGTAVSFEDIRVRIDNPRIGVRLGIIDSCRGGAWTGTRGLSEAPVFEVKNVTPLSNEGSVLIASSSGLESAHETEQYEGGFFTHHWNAALRGSGDQNEDGIVSLTEAFEYAKRYTITDTALIAETTQHPSFRMNLRGRNDLPLVQLDKQATLVSIDQVKGPIQLVHLGSGLVILEVPKGQRTVKLAIEPGHYLARIREQGHTRAYKFVVEAETPLSVREDQLELMGQNELAARGRKIHPSKTSFEAGAIFTSYASDDIRIISPEFALKYSRKHFELRGLWGLSGNSADAAEHSIRSLTPFNPYLSGFGIINLDKARIRLGLGFTLPLFLDLYAEDPSAISQVGDRYYGVNSASFYNHLNTALHGGYNSFMYLNDALGVTVNVEGQLQLGVSSLTAEVTPFNIIILDNSEEYQFDHGFGVQAALQFRTAFSRWLGVGLRTQLAILPTGFTINQSLRNSEGAVDQPLNGPFYTKPQFSIKPFIFVNYKKLRLSTGVHLNAAVPYRSVYGIDLGVSFIL